MSDLRLCGYCKSWHSRPCGEGCQWSPNDPTLESLSTPKCTCGAPSDGKWAGKAAKVIADIGEKKPAK